MDSFVKYFLKNKAFSWLLLLLVFTGGIWAYIHMGKLEDAPFTIKQAVVTTAYDGLSRCVGFRGTATSDGYLGGVDPVFGRIVLSEN